MPPDKDGEQRAGAGRATPEARERHFEAELSLARLRLQKPLVAALERAAEAEARAGYLENRVADERAAGRQSRLRDARQFGFSNVSRADLAKIADEKLNDAESMLQLRAEQHQAKQQAHADNVEAAEECVAQRARERKAKP